MGCYRLGGSLKQGETRKMLVARSNMSENILFRTRCKDHKSIQPSKKMIRARLVSETREKKSEEEGKRPKKREKSWIVIFFKTLSNLHNIRSILRENGNFKTTRLDINQKISNNPFFNTIKGVILEQTVAPVQKKCRTFANG